MHEFTRMELDFERVLIEKESVFRTIITRKFNSKNMQYDADDVNNVLSSLRYRSFRYIENYNPKRVKIMTYCWNIASNEAIRYIEKKLRRGYALHEEYYDDLPELRMSRDNPFDSGGHCDDGLSVEMSILLNSLPQDQRDVLIGIELTGYSMKEYSDRYGIKESEVKSRLSKAKQRMREMILESRNA